MSKKLTGRNPLAYVGVEAPTPPNMITATTSPSSGARNANIGDFWLNTANSTVYVLNSMTVLGAQWIPVSLSFATITLTSAQIKAIHGTPIMIVPTLGPNQLPLPIATTAQLNYGGNNAFTNVGAGQLNLVYQKGAQQSTGLFELLSATQITGAVNEIGIGAKTGFFTTASVLGSGLAIVNSSGTEFAGNAANDNTIDVNVWYIISTP